MIKKHQNDNPFEIIFTDLSFDNTIKGSILDGGGALIKAIKAEDIAIKIAVITGHTETSRVYNVIYNLNPDVYLVKNKCDVTELGFAIEKMRANEYCYSHEVHQKIMKRNIIQIKMDEVAIQILKELHNHPEISNLEGVIHKDDRSYVKLRSIETK